MSNPDTFGNPDTFDDMLAWMDRQPALVADEQHVRDMEAVRADGLAIKDIPHERRSDQVILAALAQNGSAILHLDDLALCTDAMRTVAILSTGIKTRDVNGTTQRYFVSTLSPEDAAGHPQLAAWVQENWTTGQGLGNLLATQFGPRTASQWAASFVDALPHSDTQRDTAAGRTDSPRTRMQPRL